MNRLSKAYNTDNKFCILLESYYPAIGGTETQIRLLVEDLVGNGIQVNVITRRLNCSLKKIESLDGCTIYRVSPLGAGQLKKWGMLFSCLPKLIQLNRKYDLIFVPGFRILGIAAIIVSKIFKKKCIFCAISNGEMSGDFFLSGLRSLNLERYLSFFKIFIKMRNILLRKANSFVSMSTMIANELINAGVDSRKIIPIPNPVDTKIYFPADDDMKLKLRRNLGLPKEGKIVVFTGRLLTIKGLPLLLRVWKKILQKQTNVILLIVGAGGNDLHNCEEELKKYVRTNELENKVIFTGAVTNVSEYLQASDIFVFPTENEAFGISLIEAMACGLPVISTNTGGIKDIIEDKKNGLVVEVNNFQQLFDAIESIITDNSLSSSFGRRALETVKKKYSRQLVNDKYLTLFINTL